MYKMRTEAGLIPVVSNGFNLKRVTTLYYADKLGSSVFWIVRPKDCDKLRNIGYKVQSITVPALHHPRALNYGHKTILDYSSLVWI